MTIWTFLQLKSPTLPIFTKTPQYRWSTHWVNHANNLKVKIKEKSSNGQLKEAVVAFHFSLIPVYDSTKKKIPKKQNYQINEAYTRHALIWDLRHF